jgi:hypothetical protein
MTPKQAIDCFFELYGVRYPGTDSLLDYLEEKGFVVVPTTPTESMLMAGETTYVQISREEADDCWRLMIEARPR